jgi:protein-tyrosine phosphatase
MPRIDVHSHLLPNVDDGSQNAAESIAMASRLVDAGYSHAVCTPHIWPNLDNNKISIAARVGDLQEQLNAAGVPLTLLPGGELHLSRQLAETPVEDLVTYNFAGKYALFDFWLDALPGYFEACIRRLQHAGIQPVLAHPERIEVIQRHPTFINYAADVGLLLQCNLECIGEGEMTLRGRLATQWLREGRYFMIGSDSHRLNTLERRMIGLERAADLVGHAALDRLTIENPSIVIGS